MFSAVDPALPKPQLYDELVRALVATIGGEDDALANLANAAALVFHSLPGINWAGFYLKRGQELVLGPFQGAPACVRIPLGHGVCGTAAARRETVVVPDVHAFPGHITCDPASRSEIVVPLVSGGDVVGVLDVDAPTTGRFDEADREGLERVCASVVVRIKWGKLVAPTVTSRTS